jgi:hypothetical protein
MQTITTIGLDIAKSVFQVHGVDAAGQVIIRRHSCVRALSRWALLLYEYQYSSTSMIVITRSVMEGSDGSGECIDRARSK